jgi:hypothetical protein
MWWIGLTRQPPTIRRILISYPKIPLDTTAKKGHIVPMEHTQPIGYFAPHPRRIERFSLFRPDGTLSNTYGAGQTLAEIEAEYFAATPYRIEGTELVAR